MGCCHSCNASSPQGVVANNESAHPAAPQQPHNLPPPRQPPRSGLPPSSCRPNQAIRAPSPLSRSPKNVSNVHPPWTRSHLQLQRQIFFETRVTGHAEIWAVLQEVCQLLRRNELQQAQAVLDAANISCPNGRFAKGRGRNRDRKGGGVFDERGVLYDIPEWVVVDPGDVIEDGHPHHEKDIDGGSDGADDDEGPYEGDGIRISREDKGKGRAEDLDLGEKVTVRCRLSSSAVDKVVEYHTKQPAGVVVERVREHFGGANVRVMFRGRVVDESKPLSECGWTSKDMLSVFVTN